MKIKSSQIIEAFTKSKIYPRLPKNFVISDGSYFCPRINFVQYVLYPAFKMWLLDCGLEKWTYQWDCDNFADAFKLFCCAYHSQKMDDKTSGIAIGVINYVAQSRGKGTPKGAHAINIIYAELPETDQNGNPVFNLFFLEPQNGQLYELSLREFKSIYTVYI